MSLDHDLPPLPLDPPTSFTSRSRSKASSRVSYDEISSRILSLSTQLDSERHRAEEAERRLAELTDHFKAINDARILAMQDAARAKEELTMYKIQLETAQREIFKAQDIIAIVDKQRYAAEKEAAENRSKARALNETIMMQSAREEAWRIGLKEGLSRGRDIALGEFPPSVAPFQDQQQYDAFDDEDEYSLHSSRRSPSPEVEPTPYRMRGRSEVASERGSTIHRRGGSPTPVNIAPILPTAPSQASQSRAGSIHPSENIRPISVRNASPQPRMSHAFTMPDNFIPSLGADNMIRLPPPFELSRTPEPVPPPSLPAVAASDASQDPLPVPPPGSVASDRSHRTGRHRRNSSSASSALSALDIVNDPFSASLRTPMTAITEIQSQSTSPHPASAGSLHKQRSIGERSMQGSLNGQPDRPISVSGFSTSNNLPILEQNPSTSNISTPPQIDVFPPSHPASQKTESIRTASMRGASRMSGSPASSMRAPLPSSGPLSAGSSTGRASRMYTPAAPSSEFGENSYSRHGKEQQGNPIHSRDDDAESQVSSAISGDTLTTPPHRRRRSHRPSRSGEDEREMEKERERIEELQKEQSQAGSLAPEFNQPAGSSSTAVWELPDHANGVLFYTEASKKKKKGKR